MLVVEDEGMTLTLLTRSLTRGGYEVVGTASDGVEAVEQARATEPDFILMDIAMPGMDGIEATKRILADHFIPIIMLTAYGDDYHRDKAREAGAWGYLVKPITRGTLVPAIEQIFDQRERIQ